MVAEGTILTNGAGDDGPSTAPSTNYVGDVHGTYPTLGFKPFNKFYPIDMGYIHENVSDCPPLRIA
jgi:hypothetical protein